MYLNLAFKPISKKRDNIRNMIQIIIFLSFHLSTNAVTMFLNVAAYQLHHCIRIKIYTTTTLEIEQIYTSKEQKPLHMEIGHFYKSRSDYTTN